MRERETGFNSPRKKNTTRVKYSMQLGNTRFIFPRRKYHSREILPT